jgi:WD40 repeat protein
MALTVMMQITFGDFNKLQGNTHQMKINADRAYCVIILVLVSTLLCLLPMSAQEFSDIVQIELESQFGNINADNSNRYGDFLISPDKTHVAVRFGEHIEIWNINRQDLVATIDDRLGVFAWNPESDQLATMTLETELSIWDAFSGDLLQTYEGISIQSNGVRSIQWYQPNLITSGSFEYLLWDLISEDLPEIIECHPFGSRHWWSPDKKRFATLGSSTLIWVCNDEFERVASFEGYTTVAWNPDSSEVATVGILNTLRVWDIASGEVVSTSEGGENNITNISWHSEGQRIVTGHLNDEIRIWERMTPDSFWQIGNVSIMGLHQVDWLGNHLITTSSSHGIQVWNLIEH